MYRRALAMFTNTGAFALHFAARCDSILAVDLARDSLQQGRRNAELNQIGNIEFLEGNPFDVLKDLDRSGEKFGAVCLDPPAFAKNRGALHGAIGGYKEINLRAMKLLNPEGILVTSSCSYLCSAKFRTFTDVVLTQGFSQVHIHDVARLRPAWR